MAALLWLRTRCRARQLPDWPPAASPHRCTGSPEFGVLARSVAVTSAPPRENQNGVAIVRPCRMGTSSGTRVTAWPSRSSMRSLRPVVTSSAWETSATRHRAALPMTACSGGAGAPPWPAFCDCWRESEEQALGHHPWSAEQVRARQMGPCLCLRRTLSSIVVRSRTPES